jgi:hypothetical protein
MLSDPAPPKPELNINQDGAEVVQADRADDELGVVRASFQIDRVTAGPTRTAVSLGTSMTSASSLNWSWPEIT